ncbi:MAG: RNA-binding S4 domain-containing protein [Rhizobiaceae bacterium]|nr:RNA-binding S4 domain-containing protein [Rhizobiaceae bacterium]
MDQQPIQGQRIDKWLYFARVVKTRTLASRLVQSSKVRINRQKIDNAARRVRPGDVLTISLRGKVLVLKVLGMGARRGPAAEAVQLFENLSPPPVAALRSSDALAAEADTVEQE